MAVRNDFSSGEVLTAADLNDTFASKLPYSYGTATPSTSVDGFLWYDENDTPPTPKFWDGAAFQAIGGGGKILQIVRATDASNRTTTSSSFTDVTGMSVTITPTDATSAIFVIASFLAEADRSGAATDAAYQITDASNNALSGAEESEIRVFISGSTSSDIRGHFTLIGYSTPATTSATTYKLRFKRLNTGVTAKVLNTTNTGQMLAIEVAS